MRQALFIFVLLLPGNLFSHEPENKIFNSIHLSINNSHTGKIDLSENYGFGFGLEHIFWEDRRMNIYSGVEFNHTSQFFESLYNGHFSNLYDVTYKMNYFSIPVGVRLNLGNSRLVSLNLGGFADISILSRCQGRCVYYDYSQAGTDLFSSEIEFEEDIFKDIFGLTTGISFQIPLEKTWLIIGADYKYGINRIRDYMDIVNSNYIRLSIGYRYR